MSKSATINGRLVHEDELRHEAHMGNNLVNVPFVLRHLELMARCNGDADARAVRGALNLIQVLAEQANLHVEDLAVRVEDVL